MRRRAIWTFLLVAVLAAQALAVPSPIWAEDPTSYTVVEGDTLSGIALQFGLDAADLAAANGLELEAILQIGQRLTIPAGAPKSGEAASEAGAAPAGGYTVVEGDSLDAIALRFGVAPEELARANGMTRDDLLLVGRRLKLPAGAKDSGAPAAAPPSAPALEYTVQDGDTLSGIARGAGVPVDALIASNGITDPNRLAVGQKLVLPPGAQPPAARAQGGPPATAAPPPIREYVVKEDDTLYGIARQFNVSVDDLLQLNDLKVDDTLRIGQKLKVPAAAAGTAAGASSAPPAGPTGQGGTPAIGPQRAPADSGGKIVGPPSDPFNGEEYVTVLPNESLDSVARRAGVAPDALLKYNNLTAPGELRAGQPLRVPHAVDWQMPLYGTITTYYGESTPFDARHEAVDIAVPVGTPVRAMKEGTVIVAGLAVPGDLHASYGLMVVLQHAGGYTSLYGHLSSIQVALGQKVKQGEIIGLSGATGLATGPHLHVGLRKGTQNLDPLKYAR